MNLNIILFACVFVFMLIIVCSAKTSDEQIEGFDNTTWKRTPKCKYVLSKTLKKLLEENELKKTKGEDWKVYLPCTYNDIKKEINGVNASSSDQNVFIIDGADQISSKKYLWKNLRKAYDLDTLKKMMPSTYILSSKSDLIRFRKDYKKDKLYILKKDIQRQQGLKITKNLNEIIKAASDGYVVVQELLQDPYLIKGRKINMRFYILITCVDNKVSCYAHKNGFMYYTKLPFKKNSGEWKHNITTGYIDRKVYAENPLTHDDFRDYLNKNEKKNKLNGKIVFNRIYNLLKKAMHGIRISICNKKHKTHHKSFQLFGIDIGLSDKLEPVLIEVNKGPDMGSKDKRDGDLKYGVMEDIFKTLKLISKGNDENFIKLF